MTSYLWYIAMLQLFQPVQSGWTEVVFVTIAACPWLAVDSPRVVVFFLGPFLQSYFQTISTPWPPVSRFPMYKDTAGSWVAAMAAISCDTWGYDAQRQSLGRESIVSAFFYFCNSWNHFELNGCCSLHLLVALVVYQNLEFQDLLQDGYLNTLEERQVHGNTYADINNHRHLTL